MYVCASVSTQVGVVVTTLAFTLAVPLKVPVQLSLLPTNVSRLMSNLEVVPNCQTSDKPPPLEVPEPDALYSMVPCQLLTPRNSDTLPVAKPCAAVSMDIT